MSEEAAGRAGAGDDVTELTHHADEAEAEAAARSLREAGLSPIVTETVESISQREMWSLSVPVDEADRAVEVLGLAGPGSPAGGAGDSPADASSDGVDSSPEGVAPPAGPTKGTSRLGRYLAEDQANAAARRLLEAGVTPIVERELEPPSQREVWWLAVFAHDLRRASELLGVSLPEGSAGIVAGAVPSDQPLTRQQTRWRVPREKLWRYVGAYVALVVVVGLVAFFVAFKIFERDSDDLPPPPTFGPVITSEAPG